MSPDIHLFSVLLVSESDCDIVGLTFEVCLEELYFSLVSVSKDHVSEFDGSGSSSFPCLRKFASSHGEEETS